MILNTEPVNLGMRAVEKLVPGVLRRSAAYGVVRSVNSWHGSAILMTIPLRLCGRKMIVCTEYLVRFMDPPRSITSSLRAANLTSAHNFTPYWKALIILLGADFPSFLRRER